MTPEQQAAYISAQIACALIEAFGMVAENTKRTSEGLTIAYGEEAFDALMEKYGIHHNAVVSFFQQ